jgi:hypothetical protein
MRVGYGSIKQSTFRTINFPEGLAEGISKLAAS